MPLVIVTGLPTSGKTTRAKQLHQYLGRKIESQPPASRYRLHLVSDQTQCVSRTVYDLSAERLPAHTRSSNAAEKDARAAVSSAVRRLLSPRDIVILDGLNYIKGWRYQLYCEAKNLGTPSVLLQVGCAVATARAVNEARLRRRAAARAAGLDVSADHQDDPEGAYEPAAWENLVFRYEEPNAMTRWDSPLFTLVWDDDGPQANHVFDAAWEAIAGDTRKLVRPNQSTVQRSRDLGGDYLYVLDRETQDIVKRILDQQLDEGGGEVGVPKTGDAGGATLSVVMPSKKLGLPQLQRYRRTYMNMNRGGIGLEAMGTLAVDRIRENFIAYLNDVFEKAE